MRDQFSSDRSAAGDHSSQAPTGPGDGPSSEPQGGHGAAGFTSDFGPQFGDRLDEEAPSPRWTSEFGDDSAAASWSPRHLIEAILQLVGSLIFVAVAGSIAFRMIPMASMTKSFGSGFGMFALIPLMVLAVGVFSAVQGAIEVVREIRSRPRQ